MRKLGLGLLLVLAACGGNGGGSSSVGGTSDLPVGCVDVGSISNSGGDITIIANCTSGTGNTVQTCFSTGPAGTTPEPVACDNGGSGQTIGATPTP